jgi:hypothetical protein
MVTYYYRIKLGSPSEKMYRNGDRFQGWYGEDSVIEHLIELFIMENTIREINIIKRVLVTIHEFARRGVLYKGQRMKVQGRKPLITSPQEYQIIIDSMEQEYGRVTAIYQINEYREEESLPDVGLSTVRHTMNRLGPVLRKIRRRQQGNIDLNSPWAKAIQIWVTQLLVRLGTHEFNIQVPENQHLRLTGTPSYFDPEVFSPLSQHQLFFFDECHKKCEIGRTSETVYTFEHMVFVTEHLLI